MDASNHTQYPSDPADLFVQLYDELPVDLFRGFEPTAWAEEVNIRRKSEEICQMVWGNGVVNIGQLEKLVGQFDPRGIFTVLLGLESALEIVNPYRPNFIQGRLAPLAVRYVVTGQFNNPDVTRGALLPRCTLPGKPTGKRRKGEFFKLHRVPQDLWDHVKVEHNGFDRQPHFPREEPVKIGCVPLLETLDLDVSVSFNQRSGHPVYQVKPIDSAALRQRIDEILQRLENSGASIGIMPEGSLCDSLLEYWRERAYETFRLGSPLRWLLVGTGPLHDSNPPPNRAILLDRLTGATLISQDKLCCFTLTPDQVQSWGLSNNSPEGVIEEDIFEGRTISIWDSSLGRLAVLICEDISQSKEWDRELLSCGVSHLLVPIFSTPISPGRWEEDAAKRAVNTLGSWVIVVNSLAIANSMPHKVSDDQSFSALIASSGSPNRLSYSYTLQFCKSPSGSVPGRVAIGGSSGVLPSVLPAAGH
ncbi:hypothetical protein ACGFX2_17360 [Streptomyces goshikiensis]|uniref:hypothetical protein n=1 Tax=Streptomyces goshikiensis TaxID=1942 RepID=UPI00371EA90B